jgi:hypothetical protein
MAETDPRFTLMAGAAAGAVAAGAVWYSDLSCLELVRPGGACTGFSADPAVFAAAALLLPVLAASWKSFLSV